MATVPEHVHNSTIGAGYRQWTALLDRLDQFSPWLVVAAYAVVCTVLLVGGAIAALYLGAVLPGMAGVAVFFTVGLALVAAAPTAARALFTQVLDEHNDRLELCPRTNGHSGRETRMHPRTDGDADGGEGVCSVCRRLASGRITLTVDGQTTFVAVPLCAACRKTLTDTPWIEEGRLTTANSRAI